MRNAVLFYWWHCTDKPEATPKGGFRILEIRRRDTARAPGTPNI